VAKTKDIDCTSCVNCGWNNKVNEIRRGYLRGLTNKQLSNFIDKWYRGEAWK
jgi:hypothetical protein